MQVILTHEQADFDAIASLLGAYLLQKDAFVVLPNVLNRNVQSFMHLYGADLPFNTVNDLPDEPITSITLVDTQALITLKGMRKDTRVVVIDHHQKKADFPGQWHFENVDTIACTTRFVENLQDNNGHLSLIQATLLLLGIYEDSGSLSYAHTTPRDVSAVAYLLENGASLKIAAEFLNPPLSPGQHQVFDELLSNLESLNLQNCKILVSWADAPQLDDEVSSIAHKLCDLLDPDALFILVRTKEGIRLVARSISDQVNVAEIAKRYNGGGHPRAASALVKNNKENPRQLADLLRVFKDELPAFIEPAITVSQIMSKKPLTIGLDTTASQAYQLMQRFGYEGYPVVEEDQVKGLLTRRAVDRALSHKLDLTAASLMEAGSVSVAPQDSLEKLQRIMADSGWGQVPVVDPATGKIIAITTRTDLLKVLAGRSQGSIERKNLASEIAAVLPPARLNLLRLISQSAKELQLPIFLVGGFARDLLLKTPSIDLDFVVEGDAILLAERLSELYGGRITSHRKFGTAKWQLDFANPVLINQLGIESTSPDISQLPANIDLISSRTEFYEKPSALPIVKKSSIKLDLHRRDFSINTMAVRLDGAHFGDLYDYWGGLNDLKNGKIRVLHSLSFVDDPTRMLRAVRFEQRFNFSIEPRTLQLMSEACSLLGEVSGERIRHEIDQMLVEKQVTKMMARLSQLDLLSQIHPSLSWTEELAAQFNELMDNPLPKEWGFSGRSDNQEQKVQGAHILLLSRLQKHDLLLVSSRLRLKNNLARLILQANQLQSRLADLAGMPASQAAAALQDCPPLVLYSLYLQSRSEQTRAVLKNYAVHWRLLKPVADGKKLMEMGVEVGPAIGDILDILKAAWIDGEITTPGEESQLLQQILRASQN
jgi:tRNA nucleotidyltransferase (CCA-adding enzyme)